MKTIGIVRRIDELGRIVIPKEIRKTLTIKVGDPVEIFTNKDKIILKKYKLMEEVNDKDSIYKKKIEEKIKELEEADKDWTEELGNPETDFEIADRNLKTIKNQIDILK